MFTGLHSFPVLLRSPTKSVIFLVPKIVLCLDPSLRLKRQNERRTVQWIVETRNQRIIHFDLIEDGTHKYYSEVTLLFTFSGTVCRVWVEQNQLLRGRGWGGNSGFLLIEIFLIDLLRPNHLRENFFILCCVVHSDFNEVSRSESSTMIWVVILGCFNHGNLRFPDFLPFDYRVSPHMFIDLVFTRL